jgi:hypothetical protein
VEQRDEASHLGGTMRLGAQAVTLAKGSLAAQSYGATTIEERHRHRYEVNNNYRARLEKAGDAPIDKGRVFGDTHLHLQGEAVAGLPTGLGAHLDEVDEVTLAFP